MKTVVLGKSGSGKTRYMYSEIEKRIVEGKKGIVLSSDMRIEVFGEILLEKHGNEFFEKDGLGDVKIINVYGIDRDNLELIVNKIKNEKYDFIVIESMSLKREVCELLFTIDFNDLEMFFVSSINNGAIDNLKNGIRDYNNLDNVINQFNEAILFERNDDKISIKKSLIEDRILLGFENEVIYGIDSLKHCEFN